VTSYGFWAVCCRARFLEHCVQGQTCTSWYW